MVRNRQDKGAQDICKVEVVVVRSVVRDNLCRAAELSKTSRSGQRRLQVSLRLR